MVFHVGTLLDVARRRVGEHHGVTRQLVVHILFLGWVCADIEVLLMVLAILLETVGS